MSWNHDHVEELLAGLVLGGLDGDDVALAERALDEHVPGCERCRESLDAFREVAGDTGLLAPAVRTPDTLDAKVLRAISATPARRSRPGWAAMAAGVAAASLIGLGAWNSLLAGRLDRTQSALVQAETQNDWITEALSDKPAVTEVDTSAGIRVSMVYNRLRDRTYLVAAQMPRIEGVYQVWLLDDAGEAWSPGVLEMSGGRGMLPIDGDLAGWTRMMLTEEPGDGSPTPTASPLAFATLSQQE